MGRLFLRAPGLLCLPLLWGGAPVGQAVCVCVCWLVGGPGRVHIAALSFPISWGAKNIIILNPEFCL